MDMRGALVDFRAQARWRSRVVLALLLAISASVPAAESKTPVAVPPAASATAAAVTAGDTAGAPEALRTALPPVPEIVRDGQVVRWRAGSAEVVIAAVDPASGDAFAVTEAGQMRIARQLIVDHQTAALPAIPALAAQAKRAQVPLAGLTLRAGVITGFNLRDEQVVVLAEGVLRRAPAGPPDFSVVDARLAAAQAALLAAVPECRLTAAGRRSLVDVIGRLAGRDGGQAYDELRPSMVRRLVRHGWLRAWFAAPLVAEAESAVAAAELPLPLLAYTGPGLRLEQLQDACGRGGWVLRTPQAVRYMHEEATPAFCGWNPGLTLAVTLPPDADPLCDSVNAVAARLLNGDEELARWSVADGLVCDAQRWRAAITSGERYTDTLPPHIRIDDLHGDVSGLVMAGGVLRPVAETGGADAASAAAGRKEAERFIADAARLLPTAGQLDLLGEYLFTYAYPSPDPLHPELLGNRQALADIQRTVWQTVGGSAGGIMHGDCADIAELYHAILTAQGRNPIVIGLPRHAACVWAERRLVEPQADPAGPPAQEAPPLAAGDLKLGVQQERQDAAAPPTLQWQVFLLQTGMPLAFTDPELPACLRKTYTAFDPTMAFDPIRVPLLLRFAGESARSTWYLSWRIFAEPDYARAMIAVQRDLYFQTYQHGIAGVQRIIAAGDEDAANLNELSGLYRSTGQYGLAADWYAKALAKTGDAGDRLTMSVGLVRLLCAAGRLAEARTLAADVVEHQLPAQSARLGPAALQVGLNLAAACSGDDDEPLLPELAAHVLVTTVSPTLARGIDGYAGWLAGAQFDEQRWQRDPAARSARGLMAKYAVAAIGLARRQGGLHGEAEVLNAPVQRWLAGVAFHDIDNVSEVMDRYALVGLWYETALGLAELDRMLDGVQPAGAAIAHAERTGDAAQVQRDLPWIRASVPYWYRRLAELFRRGNAVPDAQAAARLAQRLNEAVAATATLALDSSASQTYALAGAELAALAAHDEAALRQVLRRVAESNDKDLLEGAARSIGGAAHFFDLAWFTRVLSAWREVVDYKPKYFRIAWMAVRTGAPQHALLAAKLAAERFADDPVLGEEYGFMRTLLAAAAVAPSPAPAPVPAP